MTVQAPDAITEKVFSKGFAGTSWNGASLLTGHLESLIATFPVSAAGSDGQRNTIQCVDSTMLPREKPSVWLFSVKT
jgi:hypothetical protein